MFNTEQEFLDAFLAFPGWETDPSVVQTIMTIVVDGVPFIVTGSMDTVPDMVALIASINNSEAGEFVMASVAQDARTHDFYLAINARVPSVASITVLNDQTLLFNRVAPPPNDGSINGDFITSVAAIEVIGSDPVIGDQIEPKNDGSVLERVYLPLHTRITSDEPVVDINYWASYTHNTGSFAMNASSVATSYHPVTGEPVVYALYVDNTGGNLVVECRYADGIEGGQLVSGLNNSRVAFVPLPSSFVDSYYSTVTILSSTIVYAENTGYLYIKSIVCGQLYDTGYSSASTSCVAITKLNRTLNMDTMSWTRVVFHNQLFHSPTGFGVYQRSDGGLLVDSDNNLIVACNVNAFIEPPNGGTPDHTPALELMKINGQDGSIEWSRMVFSDSFNSNVAGPNSTLDNFTPSSDSHYPVPACLDVNAMGDIFVGHASLLHKFSPTGNNIWSKFFPTAVPNTMLGGDYTFPYVSGVQVHKTTGEIFVAVAGAVNNNTDPTSVHATIYKMSDTNTGDVTNITNEFRFTHIEYARKSNTWNNRRVWMCDAVVIKLDSVTSTLYAATRLHSHDGNVARGMTVAKINATDMALQWSYDTAFTEFFGETCEDNSIAGDIYQLDGPTSYATVWEIRTDGGYTNFDFVRDDNDNVTSVCYCVPMLIKPFDGRSSPVAHRGGWLVAQSPAIVPVADGGGEIKYSHVETTQIDAAYNELFVTGGQYAANGMALPVPSDYYSTFAYIVNSPSHNCTFDPNPTQQFLFMLPPMSSTITPSLYVDNIARVGELQLGGIIAPPASLIGSITDKKGSFRVSAAGIFYCTADYDGTTGIWKMVPFGGGSGGAAFRTIPPGYNPNTGVITGGPADRIGELYVSNEGTILMCRATYNGADETWSPLSIPQTSGLTITPYTSYMDDYTNADYWPDGAYLSQYYIVMSPDGGNTPADIVGGCVGKPGANSIITSFVAPRAMWITDTNAGAGFWRCHTAPSSQVILTLRINGLTIGSIRFDAGNTYGTLRTGWGQYNMTAGDVFTVTAPATQDSTFADVYFSVIGGVQ